MPTNSERNDPQQAQSSDWLDRFEHFNLHFGRYLRDVAGVVLIAIALMSLLALWNLTSGILLTPWLDFLSKWFGWGSYIIILAIGYGGLVLFRRDDKPLGLIRSPFSGTRRSSDVGPARRYRKQFARPRRSRAGRRTSGLEHSLFA